MKLIFRTAPLFLLGSVLWLTACKDPGIPTLERPYLDRLETFREELKSERESTWMGLLGFYLLKDGSQTLGSGPSADIVFPEQFPLKIMTVAIFGDSLTAIPEPGLELTYNDKPFISPVRDRVDENISTRRYRWGVYEWWIRHMGEQPGIRLRTVERQLMDKSQVSYFEPDAQWIKEAEFTPNLVPVTIPVQNSLGASIEMTAVGSATFSHEGKSYTIDILEDAEDDDRYFVIIGDETNGVSTYPAGRYVYVPMPDENIITLDFNYLYSPPCAFTDHATCPFPPPRNRLELSIHAGEKFKSN